MIINIVGGSGFIGTRLGSLFELERLAFKIVDKALSKEFQETSIIADVRSVKALDSGISDNSILINLAAAS